MIRNYLKSLWQGLKALWQCIALMIVFEIIMSPLALLFFWALETEPYMLILGVLYFVFIGMPLFGKYFRWMTKHTWYSWEISENED